MKYCLVADDGQARAVVAESNNVAWPHVTASEFSKNTDCQWHVCRREPSRNGFKLITLQTWKKGVKL